MVQVEERDKGQPADLFAVIGQPLPQKPSALRRKDMAGIQGCPPNTSRPCTQKLPSLSSILCE